MLRTPFSSTSLYRTTLLNEYILTSQYAGVHGASAAPVAHKTCNRRFIADILPHADARGS